MTEEERAEYGLTRRAWADLIQEAPSGSVAAALQMISEPLYERVGERAGSGIGKTFSDNKKLFYSTCDLANVVAWAKYETVTIAGASYTPCSTKFAGLLVTEGGRAWLIWLCHCAQTGHTTVDEYVLGMNAHHPWSGLGLASRTGIQMVAKLNSEVARLVPKK